MKCSLFFILQLLTFSISAQLVTKKNGKFGINSLITGHTLVEQTYDSIYQLSLMPGVGKNNPDRQLLPIFACLNNNQIQLFNSNSASFYSGVFDEIKLYRQLDEQNYGINPLGYVPYWVDCFMLRTDNKWGFISYKKEYSFHDKHEKTDTFNIITPQYSDLKFIEEEFSYDSKKYTRRKRILAAKKDSLWGAVSFETGELLVPFRYQFPIHKFGNSYDNRGPEFLSVNGGFIPYYIAGNGRNTKPQIIINPQQRDIWFEIDFLPSIHIYNEFSNQYLYVEPEKENEGFFKLFEYNTGKELVSYKRNLRYKFFETSRMVENILIIYESTPYEKLFRQTWFNLSSGKEILLVEGKSYNAINFSISKKNKSIVLKGRKAAGKIVGEGKNMKIEWHTKKLQSKYGI